MPTAGSRRIDPRTKNDLWAIGALLAGLFLALATAPGISLTGPVGIALGSALRAFFGAGAAAVPLIPLFWAVALFGHLDRSLGRRVTILLAGLSLTVPFALGVGYQTWESVAHAALVAGALPEYPPWVGLAGGFLAFELRIIGPVGEGLLALGAFSALTIATVGWNPLGVLRKRGSGVRGPGTAVTEGEAEPAAAPEDLFADAEEVADEEESVPAKRPRRPRSGASSRASGPGPRAPALDELPPIDLLNPPAPQAANFESDLDRLQAVLLDTLKQFKVEGSVVGRTTGPVVTQFEVVPAAGVKVGRIAALADDLALTMRAQSIRIVAPIPGKGAVGVEVPNPTARMVGFRELLEAAEWQKAVQRLLLPVALGRDLEGRPIIADLTKMPHLLIAGATGSGKSVCINTLITSLVYRYTPAELRFLMIDPKMVELSMYNALPHLRHRVVTDNKDAAHVLRWAVWEMQDRYELLHANNARNLVDFNHKLAEDPSKIVKPNGEAYEEGPLPYILLFVDELADLIMTVQAEVETPLLLLAQKARAIGIHLILATQRPSVNVITGSIKANFPCRIAFRVASKIDSRTILDQNGAEALLGNGDMLFMPPGKSDLMRLQGAFVGTDETERLMHWFDARREERLAAVQAEVAEESGVGGEADILEVVRARIAEEEGGDEGGGDAGGGAADRDPLFRQAAEVCIQNQLGSTSLLQRRLKIGYGRAARIIDQLHDAGILGPPDGSKARDVLVGMADLDQY
jgi:S-DNA-T family DNA segregation ATPase FtsK/SpoIIIE